MRFSKIKDNDIANGLGITMSFGLKDARIIVKDVLIKRHGTLMEDKSLSKKT